MYCLNHIRHDSLKLPLKAIDTVCISRRTYVTFYNKNIMIRWKIGIFHNEINAVLNITIQLLYIIIAFFGTGNIASLNSFEVRWVTCFVTSFQPFLITGLVLLKTLAPFLCVGCCFRAVQHVTKVRNKCIKYIMPLFTYLPRSSTLWAVSNR